MQLSSWPCFTRFDWPNLTRFDWDSSTLTKFGPLLPSLIMFDQTTCDPTFSATRLTVILVVGRVAAFGVTCSKINWGNVPFAATGVAVAAGNQIAPRVAYGFDLSPGLEPPLDSLVPSFFFLFSFPQFINLKFSWLHQFGTRAKFQVVSTAWRLSGS